MALENHYKQVQRIRYFKKKLETVRSQEELLTLTKFLCIKSGELGIQPYILVILFLVPACFLFLNLPMKMEILLAFVFCLPGLYLFIKREGGLLELENIIIQKAMMFRYGFSFDAKLPEELKKFKDFHRGNHERKINLEIKGIYEGPLHSIPYHFCHLRYTDKTRGLDGKKEYQHYHRYYVFLHFSWTSGVVARSDKFARIDLPFRYRSTLSEFNKVYKLTGQSEIVCARFAKPITILHLLKFNDLLECPNFSFSENGWLCISFNDRDVFTVKEQKRLKDQVDFYQMVESGIDLPKLEPFFQLVHELIEQHDDNFDSLKK